MNISFFIILLFSLQLIYWMAGKAAAKKIESNNEYFLAGKTVKMFPLMMTFLATQVGGGIILGAAEEAYLFGWSVLFYPLGCSLGLILLGSGFGKKLSKFNVSTVAEIFEVVYQSPSLKKFASMLSVISLFLILVAQIIASKKFLMSLGFDNTPLFVAFWAIVIIYTVKGGLRAVIATDIIQAAFFFFVFMGCFIFVYFFNQPPILIEGMEMGGFASIANKLYGWLLMPLLFMLIEQDMGQRCFAGESSNVVSRASFIAGVLTLVICVIPVYFGSLAKTIGLEIPQGASVLMIVIAKMTNPWISAVVGCAILAAIISTASSLINAISSNVSNDFIFSLCSDKNTTRLAQGISGMIAISAIAVSFYFNQIVDLLILSYELSICCLFVPLFIALFRKQGSFLAAFISIFFGALSFCLLRFYPIEFPKEVASLLFSLFGYCSGEAIVGYQNRRRSTREVP